MKHKKRMAALLLLALFAAGQGFAQDHSVRVDPRPGDMVNEHSRPGAHDGKTGGYSDENQTAGLVRQSDEFRRLGDMYYEKEDIEKAVAYYERAIMLDENNMRAHENMAAAIEVRDAMELAVSERYHRAMEYLRKGMIDLAVDELVLEIKENPDNDAVRIRLKEIETRYR
jgi:tetratricopeptide (TPR) repeat protein